MRLFRLFKLSFVGTLLFSPTMAQEADKVHEEALKVLRSQTGDTNRPAAAPSAALGTSDSRADRDARLKAEAQQRLADRERAQAEKRRQFEEYVKERERLRQQKLERAGTPGANVHNQALDVLRQTTPGSTPAPATSQPGLTVPPPSSPAPTSVQPPPTVQPPPAAQPAPTPPVRRPVTPPVAQPAQDDVQQRALEILREQQAQKAATSPAPVSEPELAPRVVASPVPSSRNDVHQKALEVLRQTESQSAPAATPTSVAPSQPVATPTPPPRELKPSPELQRRLDEMQKELNAPAPRSGVSAADDGAYVKELEQRALQNRTRSVPPPVTTATTTPARRTPPPAAPAAKPALDSQTREMLRKQDAQITQKPSSVVSAPPGQSTAVLDPAAEAQAREILRKQQQAVSTAPTTPPPVSPVTASAPSVSQPSATQPQPQARPTPAPVAVSPAVPSAVGDVEYSRELEERARQAILARSEPQDAAPVPQAAPEKPVDPLAAPVPATPELEQVHNRGLETLGQVQPGEGTETRLKSKQERLRALTDLYRADRMTPAEYHKRRAQILAEPN